MLSDYNKVVDFHPVSNLRLVPLSGLRFDKSHHGAASGLAVNPLHCPQSRVGRPHGAAGWTNRNRVAASDRLVRKLDSVGAGGVQRRG